MLSFYFSGESIETIELNEETVNPGALKTGPQDFELLRVLGKGGYGKVRDIVYYILKMLVFDVWNMCLGFIVGCMFSSACVLG